MLLLRFVIKLRAVLQRSRAAKARQAAGTQGSSSPRVSRGKPHHTPLRSALRTTAARRSPSTSPELAGDLIPGADALDLAPDRNGAGAGGAADDERVQKALRRRRRRSADDAPVRACVWHVRPSTAALHAHCLSLHHSAPAAHAQAPAGARWGRGLPTAAASDATWPREARWRRVPASPAVARRRRGGSGTFAPAHPRRDGRVGAPDFRCRCAAVHGAAAVAITAPPSVACGTWQLRPASQRPAGGRGAGGCAQGRHLGCACGAASQRWPQ